MGDTTFIGLCGLGRTKGGGGLTVGEEGRVELSFGASSAVVPVGDDGRFVVGLEGREDGGVGIDGDVGGRGNAAEGEAGEVEVVILGALFWTGLSGGTFIGEVTAGSGGAGTVFTTATEGEAPPPGKYNHRS